MHEAIRVSQCSRPRDIEIAHSIRRTVFVLEQGIPESLDRDGLDERAIHVLAYHQQHPVATGRLLITETGPALAARIAVLRQYRGLGIGKRVVQTLERIAKQQGALRLTLHPHVHLETFYRGLGYRKTGTAPPAGQYPLITMEKSL